VVAILLLTGGTLICFGWLFILAIAEHREVDPMQEIHGDVAPCPWPISDKSSRANFHNAGGINP